MNVINISVNISLNILCVVITNANIRIQTHSEDMISIGQ